MLHLERVIQRDLEYPFHFESVLPTVAQRSGGTRFSPGTVGFGREAGFSAAPLTVKL
jgi:hypothetical protein